MSKIRLVTLFTLVAIITLLVAVGCTSNIPTTSTPKYNTGLDAKETSSLEYAKHFPLHYESFLRNDEMSMTEYGGNVPHSKSNGTDALPNGYKHAQPYLKNLWLGYPFMYEYNNARGHTYAIDDILEIDRVNRYGEQGVLPSTCYNCKTTMIPTYLERYGDAFWSMNFNDLREEQEPGMHSIGCALCHEPNTMELRIQSVPLNEALLRQGIDWREAPKNDMRSYVCAQCHVEYYFEAKDVGVAAKPHFPWDNGYHARDIYEFYSDGNPGVDGFKGQFADWTHAVSGTPMIKVQHPEFETWIDGTHGAAGVTCADCHMPYVRIDGKKKISAHQWTSPLKTVEQSCLQCHGDKDAGWAKERVEYTQEKTWSQLNIAQEYSVRAHEAVRLAAEFTGEKHADYDKLLAEAREYVREGQLYWDYVSAENSAGFHNPSKALETLALSQQASNNAVEAAKKATNYAISDKLDGDIKKIVPPIKEHSRKLQQSQEHLDSHVWLQYLPLLPEADLMWDGTKKLR